ncbi:benzoate carboxyl methyltransferase-like [Henckelia pumila]|uniref:benzoate carboxyl methyltransferase-like n=1 Tax=Henckelia pumila TaxID=405737 RepID=UPI003C6DF507
MGLKKILHMNSGNDKTSYANNSSFQNFVISKTWDLVDEALRNIIESDGFSGCCMNMVDMGCASGPNALWVASHVMESIQDFCNIGNSGLPEIRFFLNDLPVHDFNSLFKLVEDFNEEKRLVCGSIRSGCFVYGLPAKLLAYKVIHHSRLTY